MNYEHPNVMVTTPAPGHYVITCPPAKALTDDGWIVADGTVHISPNVPSDLLLAIVKDRGEVDQGSEMAFGFKPQNGLTMEKLLAAKAILESEEDRGEGFAKVSEFDSLPSSLTVPLQADDGLGLLPRVIKKLQEGKWRAGELAESLGVTVEEIKALDGNGFEIGHAGWCKLLTDGEAE